MVIEKIDCEAQASLQNYNMQMDLPKNNCYQRSVKILIINGNFYKIVITCSAGRFGEPFKVILSVFPANRASIQNHCTFLDYPESVIRIYSM